MKKMKFFSILVVSLFVVSCASVKESIPVVKKPTLTAEQIKGLESAEQQEADKQYNDIIASQKRKEVNQPKVTNNYVETDIRAVLLDISTQTGVNIIPDNSVQGSVSANLDNTPLESALKMILYPGGYSYRYIQDGIHSYYIVGKADPQNSSFGLLSGEKPEVVKTNRVAEVVMKKLSPFYYPYIKAEGHSLTISAPKDIVNEIKLQIATVDQSKRQIEISAKFVMVEWDKGTNLGVEWSDINLNSIGLASLVKGGANAFSADFSSELNNFLHANGYDTEVKTVAEPKIVVEDGEVGKLNVAQEHYFLILSGGGAAYNYYTTLQKDVGIKLSVQPFVTRDGKISLDVKPEVADIIGEHNYKVSGGPDQQTPIIARRSTETKLKVSNGETIAIGGLMMKSQKTKKTGIPLLRSIPVVGSVFGNKNNQDKHTELVIFITPKVIG